MGASNLGWHNDIAVGFVLDWEETGGVHLARAEIFNLNSNLNASSVEVEVSSATDDPIERTGTKKTETCCEVDG